VILDEVFGSQDEERRDLIFHGLVNLKNQFQQVLLITHIDEIKDKVEMLVQVDRASGGWSEVRVNGQAV
jgi:exonuclease SbcC